MPRATILVILPDTTEDQAVMAKKAVEIAVAKIPKAEVELNIRGK
jgi:hypothetical protein